MPHGIWHGPMGGGMMPYQAFEASLPHSASVHTSLHTSHHPTSTQYDAGLPATLRDPPRAVAALLALTSTEAKLVWSQEMMCLS